MTNKPRFRIRQRERHNASPPDGMAQEWDEVQVVEGRAVVYRCDTRDQADRWATCHADCPAPHKAHRDGRPFPRCLTGRKWHEVFTE